MEAKSRLTKSSSFYITPILNHINLKRWTDILEGRVITYDEWFASLSPEEQAQAARINGTRGDDISTEEWQKRKQESLESARQKLERLKKQEDD
ncbi:MAG: hypothetical protein MJZ31_08405 [Bacteroidales bacterium]|nr:hypothetical protein [Bacteroidales bacterium]